MLVLPTLSVMRVAVAVAVAAVDGGVGAAGEGDRRPGAEGAAGAVGEGGLGAFDDSARSVDAGAAVGAVVERQRDGAAGVPGAAGEVDDWPLGAVVSAVTVKVRCWSRRRRWWR